MPRRVHAMHKTLPARPLPQSDYDRWHCVAGAILPAAHKLYLDFFPGVLSLPVRIQHFPTGNVRAVQSDP